MVFAIALAGTWLLTPALTEFCHWRKILDWPGARKLHQTPTPRLGGLVLFISAISAWFLAYIIWPTLWQESRSLILWLALGASIIFALGLWDDLKPLRFRYKIMLQILTGIILIWAGLRVNLLFIPFWQPVKLGWLSYPVTMLWFLALLNSVNLIDGLDGLAAGVSVISAATLLLVGLHYEAYLVALIMAGVVGVGLGFLKFNFSPAKIFMGDSGALFLGYLFAVSSLICPIKSYTAVALFVPLVALGLPLLETASSFLRRTLGLRKFYAADNQHLYNLLLDFGLSSRKTVIIFYLFSILFSILSLILMFKGGALFLPILSLVVAMVLVVSLVSYILGKRMPSKSKKALV